MVGREAQRAHDVDGQRAGQVEFDGVAHARCALDFTLAVERERAGFRSQRICPAGDEFVTRANLDGGDQARRERADSSG
jgi:hypothetical protein